MIDNKNDRSTKAYKIYSPSRDVFIRTHNTGKYIWEKPSYAKRVRTQFINKFNLPKESLHIIEYDMIPVRTFEHGDMKKL
mgnify:CR=1 FL=1